MPSDLTVGGDLYLRGTQITKSDNVKKLKNGDYKENKYLYADNILMQVICRKHIIINNEEYTYYKGKIKTRNIISKIYENTTYYAHGENLKDCIEEVNFKIASENFDRDKIANDIKARGNDFIWTDYRLITGACSQGTKGWLASEKMTTENKMQIGDFYKKYKSKKVYAFERFEEFYNEFFRGETK
ncbi:MAG: hypothetical protein PHR96_05160 [Clostridia bacterium]|nr:hypothetical protein [Clostridia bacterium]